jgi:hypothetical protein
VKRPLKRSPRLRRVRKEARKPIGRASNKNTQASAVKGLPDFALLPNTHDQLAIEKLRSVPVGELAVDRFMRNNPQMIPVFREAMVGVYFNAAKAREQGKAKKGQLTKAKNALDRLTEVAENLAVVSTDGRDGLYMLLKGPPLDDKKGNRELNQLAAACWAIRMDVIRSGIALQSAITAEEKKRTERGERRKRLRTLIDYLASWWLSEGGKSLAPSVKANRRDNDRAIVHGRSGKFLELAIALFHGLDGFKKSEVEAAVTNVHEARFASKNLGRKAAA